MRRCAIPTLALVALLLPAASAWAPDHRMVVNELQLSSGGNSAAQFIELIDSVNEPFPTPPYRVVVYDGAGTRLGATEISALSLQTRNNTQPYLLATDAAGLANSDQELTVALPTGAGQVVFTRGMAETRIHVMAYGCVASPLSTEVGTATDNGPAPSDGKSAQRQSTGGFVIDSPTPKAANATGAPAGCVAPPPPPPDTTAPAQVLRVRRTQDVDRLAATVRVDEAAEAVGRASVSVPRSSRTIRFRTVRRTLGPGLATRLRFRLSRRDLRRVKAALRRGTRLRATIRISTVDAAGNVSRSQRRARLKP